MKQAGMSEKEAKREGLAAAAVWMRFEDCFCDSNLRLGTNMRFLASDMYLYIYMAVSILF